MSRRETGIIAATFLGQAVAIGATVAPFTIFVRPLQLAFDVRKGLPIEFGISLVIVMMAVTGVITGFWLDRGAPRRVMLTGIALISSALWLASYATSLWQLAVLCLLAGGGVPMLGPLTTAAVIGKAFDETRGRALGIANAGVPIGGMLFAGVAAHMIEPYGWRATLQVFGVLVGVLAGPVIWFGIPVRLEATQSGPAGTSADAWPVRRLVRSRLFWLTAAIMGVASGVATGWYVQVAPFLIDLGASPRWAGSLVAVSQGVAILGTFGFGFLADRRSPIALIALVLSLQAVCLISYALTSNLGVIAAGVVLYGLVSGGVLALYPLLVSRRFGVATLGGAMGLSNLGLLPFALSLPLLGGVLRASTGGYVAMISICVALQCVGIGAVWLGVREERRLPAGG